MTHKLLMWHVIMVLLLGTLHADDGETATYKIAKKEDISFVDRTTKRRIVRWEYRVQVPEGISEAELVTTASNIVETAKQGSPFNALGIFFYLPESDSNGLYTAGKAVFAPDGKWDDAGKVFAGSYQTHRLVVTSGNALGIKTPQSTAKLTETQKKKLFYDLIVLQDKGVRPKDSYGQIARQYGVTEKDVTDIQLEGTIKGWPMP